MALRLMLAREKLFHVGGDSPYERVDPTRKTVDFVAVENTNSLNGEIERQSLQGVAGVIFPTGRSLRSPRCCHVVSISTDTPAALSTLLNLVK